MIKLREYQRQAVDAIKDAYRRGVRRPAIVHATGAGKTVALARLASEHLREVGGRALVVAHRIELIENNAQKICDADPTLNVGIVKGNRNETRADVISCSVQTLAGERRRQMVTDVSLVIIDECFPAGTLVGGMPIERLEEGDLVPSWDEVTGAEVHAPVVMLMKRRPDALVRVVFGDERQLICTPNHPIMTDGGWCPAGGLLSGDLVVSFTHGAVALTRVDHVEVLEPGRDGTYGGMCPDGLVYNVEVAGTHTYLVNDGILVHNCHRAAAKSYLDVLRHYGCYSAGRQAGALAAGFTATMVRGDDRALGDVWQEIVHTKDIASLVREGYLVRPRGLRVRVEDLDLSKVKKSGGDYQADALGSAIEQSLAPEAIAKAMAEHAPDRRTILFAPTVHSAGVIAEALREEGFTAAVVHAGTPDVERRAVREDSESGKVQVVCNALLYTEGTDWPWISCVVIARPTRSKGTFVQMAGRGLRLHPGKTDCLIMMIGGSAAGHSLLAPVELFGESAEDLDRDPCSCVPGWTPPAGVDGGCRCGRRRCLDECPCGGGGQDCGCPRSVGDELLESDDDIGDDLEEVLGADGPLVAEVVDLFEGSDSAWAQTHDGVWFLSAGKERLIAIIPGDPAGRGGWDVVAMNSKGPGSRWVVKGVSELAYAMAHAEGDVTPAEQTIARREARWRRGKPSDAAAGLARNLGIALSGLETGGEVSTMIGRVFASRRIDPHVPAYARRQLAGTR